MEIDKIKPARKRRYITREYAMVAVLLRKVFKIPIDEMILDIEWDKSSNSLRLETLKDFDKKQGDE